MSRTNERLVRLIIIGVIALIIAAVISIVLPQIVSDTTVKLGSGVFDARVAKTDPARIQGLSGVTSLSPNQALLMVFPRSSQWQIWMKDMKIPLDIVWLNQDHTVVYIVQDATPQDSTKVIFTPTSNAQYVIELPAGSVVSQSIKLGSKAIFNDITQGVS
jgi:uncharacterized membrane protein (UPF0127 family)